MSLVNKIRAAAAAVILLATTSAALASDNIELTDGNELLRLCEAALNPHMSRSDLLDRMYLMGYVRGFTEADSRDAEYQIPPTVTLEQAVRIIKKWLEDHPTMLDQPPRVLILRALKDAYPAKKNP